DGAERALVGAATPGIEARVRARRAFHPYRRQQRGGGALDARQVVHEVVERLEAPGGGGGQALREAPPGPAGERANAHLFGASHVGVAFGEHRDGAGDVEAADADLNAALAQWPRDVEGAGKLVRLDTDQHHHAGIGRLDQPSDAVDVDARVGLVEAVNL